MSNNNSGGEFGAFFFGFLLGGMMGAAGPPVRRGDPWAAQGTHGRTALTGRGNTGRRSRQGGGRGGGHQAPC
jgi:hypothetical protein